MTIEIKIKEEPPRELVKAIEEECSPIETIKSILIDANNEDIIEGQVAGFDPDAGEIIIDLAKCCEFKKFTDKGMMVIPSMWFNMLYALYHESAHARQLEEDPELIKVDHLPEIKEHAADLEAMDKLSKWSEKGTIPKIDEMGWVGEKIKELINMFYFDTHMRNDLLEELNINEVNGTIEVEAFMAHRDDFSEESYKTLCECIDKGEFGISLKGKRYLHADEFLSANSAHDRTDE